MMHSKFIDPEGLKNLRGRVNAAVVNIPDAGWEVHWVCPMCHENMYLCAIEFIVNYTIEDARTGFAHCNGVDYAIILPRLLPEGFWEHLPARVKQ